MLQSYSFLFAIREEISHVTTKSSKCFLFSTFREPSVNRKDLQALTIVGPTSDNPVLDPLAALHLDN